MRFHAPDSNHTMKMVASAMGAAASVYCIYTAIKWGAAVALSPLIGGGSFVMVIESIYVECSEGF